MSETTKSFNGVKLKVNFTAIPSSTAMSNIASDDNISETFAKIHHWYVKTNGFQASPSPLVSTSSSGIVNALPSATGGFLKNTGTTGGTWTTIGSSDLPSGIVYNTGNVQLNGLFEPSRAGDGSQITTSNGNTNMAQLGRGEYPFSNIYGVNIHAATKSDTVKPSLNISWYDASGNNNGDWKFEIEDNTNGLTLSENGTELFNFDTDGTFTCDGLSVTTINGKVVGNNPKFTDTVTTVTSDGSVGNAITNVTASNGQLTLSRGVFLTSHPTITTSTDTNNGQQAQLSQAYVPYFTAIDSITHDENGHVKKVNTATITLPRERLSSLSGAYGSGNKTWVTTLTSDRFGAQNPTTYTSTVPTASTSAYGITKLSNTYTSADASVAATQTAVNNVYKLANNFITAYCNNHLVEISYLPSYKRYDKSGSTPVVREVFRFNAVSSTSGVTITECGCVFYRSTTATSDEPDTQTLSCELLKTDVNSSTGVTLATSNFTNKTMYSPSIGYNSDTISIFVRPWFDYTYNGTTYTAYGDIIRANIGAGFLMDSTDGCWRNINESGYPKFITEDDLGSAAYTASTAYATASHTHDTLVSKTVDADTLNSTAGNFFFKGNNLLGAINDWVGIQADAGNDKMQLLAHSNALLFRQNDSGGTNSSSWNSWHQLITAENITGSDGITVSILTTTLGSGDNALTFNRGVNLSHSNSVTAVTTAGMLKVKYDAQGHITGSSSITKSDITALGISASNHTHTNYLGAATTSSTYYGMADPDGTTTNWIRTTEQGIIPYESGSLGSGHQSLGTATWYFKNSYIDNMTSGYITLAGELPQLKFQQKTSGSEYNNANAGIKCYPSGSKDVGMNMTIQSGGNMIIGSGEYPTSFYNATKFSAESYTASGEQTYIGSDNNVYVITSAQSIADRKVFAFGSNFNLAAGGKLVFRYGTTYDSLTNHSLTSDATTTARTWTLPNATGTIALTSDIPTVSISRNLTSGTKVGTITINGTGTDLYCQTNTDTKVTDTVGTANTYYPAGLTATSTTTGTQVFDTSLKFIGTTGSKSAVGKAQLVLGNATASGTANNKQGSIVVYGSTAYAHTIQGAPTAARTLTLPNATGTLALTSDLSSYIPLSGSSAIDGNLTPHASNTYSLGSSSYKWNEIYVTYANIGSLYQANGTAGGSITSYSSIVPNSTNYNLGSTSKKWGTIYVEQISDATTGATHAVGQLVSTTGHSSMLGPLIPKVNSDANCTLGSSSYNWYAVYASNIYSNGYKVWDAGNSYVSFTCTSANTTNYTIDKQRCYCIFGKFVVINMSITTSTTFAANTAYSIATIPSAYTAGSSYVVLGTGHYQVGSPVTPTVSAWINGTSIKFSTTTANSTSTTKTIRVSFTYAMS